MNPNKTSAPRLRRASAATVLAALLVACGGGTSQVEPFNATRVLAFGDELSVLTPAGPQPEFEPGGPLGPDGPSGRKYGINVLDATPAVVCEEQPIWVQAVANLYGISFAECNPDNDPAPMGLMLAQVGAVSADLTTQIDALVASGGVVDGDMATVLVGSNDVLALYRQYPAMSEADIIDELRRRGDAAALQINRLINLGARVLLATAPDVGLSPYGLAEKAAHTDIDRSALLSRMVAAFNVRMRVGILNDGRFIGLVLADEMVQAMNKSPPTFSLSNAVAAACTVALPDCNSMTLVTGATSLAWLWADDTRLAYGGQQRLGLLAVARATGNPF